MKLTGNSSINQFIMAKLHVAVSFNQSIIQSANLLFTFLLFLISICSCFAQGSRLDWQPPEIIMDSIGVKPGMIIGEAGAGEGYFTLPLARRVGETGRVYANDIDEDDLGELSEDAEEEGLENIETVIGETEDPLFPRKELDMIIMVYVLHHLDEQVAFLENLKKYMKPGAPLVIIEKNTTRNGGPGHFMRRQEILRVLEKSNYTLSKMMTFLEKDSIYICKISET